MKQSTGFDSEDLYEQLETEHRIALILTLHHGSLRSPINLQLMRKLVIDNLVLEPVWYCLIAERLEFIEVLVMKKLSFA